MPDEIGPGEPVSPSQLAGVAFAFLPRHQRDLVTLAGEAAQPDQANLAIQLSNPVATLISVPLQFNYDQDIGPLDDGDRWQLNLQPVVPFALNEDWNLISRTILPVVRQSEVVPGAGTQTGIGGGVRYWADSLDSGAEDFGLRLSVTLLFPR